ncbi:pkgB [Symbiodinium natans]|uniref:PkgB protein n=1 Tax=Symbiodinium natans TaxID=878477 RepID=A0A812P409_9DINO|nr:pkgB [Symbiodinium natans]
MNRHPCPLCEEDLGLPCCGGLTCRPCLERWIAERIQAGSSPTCPFCRAELVLTSNVHRQAQGAEQAVRDSSLRGGFFYSNTAGIIRKMFVGAFFVLGVAGSVEAAREHFKKQRQRGEDLMSAAITAGLLVVLSSGFTCLGHGLGTVATMAPGIVHLLVNQVWVTAQLVVRRAWMDVRHAFHVPATWGELVLTSNVHPQAQGAEQALRDSNLRGGFFYSNTAGIIRKMFVGAFFVLG